MFRQQFDTYDKAVRIQIGRTLGNEFVMRLFMDELQEVNGQLLNLKMPINLTHEETTKFTKEYNTLRQRRDFINELTSLVVEVHKLTQPDTD